jgi:hypothetical protein
MPLVCDCYLFPNIEHLYHRQTELWQRGGNNDLGPAKCHALITISN